ncbi:lysis system i-spanin subunit Rz [Xenorhabdus sp. SF857]|uniref:lysis system i-spanin subunit Rz n=1 Tax=Xenorhabdus bakwenae TaxID=3026967 RepID=UPI0025580AB1|nr:lysis system i-spanin subunit Rz [Xenorhabdus sp. SF857]WFQ80043.1 lysis system i-spanin subunit Rz [Xenorhabdus sp. SF857]
MSWKLKLIAVSVGIALIGSALYSVYSVYAENGRLTGENESLTTKLSEQAAINAKQQKRISILHEHDEKQLQELTNAKSEINKLRAAADVHPERVYVRAKCPMPKTVAPASVDDADAARPTDAAVRNYWLLRERIAESRQMILGLQEFIQTQCR